MIRFLARNSYLARMRKRVFEPCIPTASKKVPDRPDWIHEINRTATGYWFSAQSDRPRAQ
jgi:hypothetical protein